MGGETCLARGLEGKWECVVLFMFLMFDTQNSYRTD